MGFPNHDPIDAAGAVDGVQDITDQPLPPLYPDSDVVDVAPLSTVPGATDVDDTDADTRVPDAPDEPRPRNRRSAQERIAQLTRRYHEEREQRSYAEIALERQAQQLAALQEQIARVTSVPQPAPVPAPAPAPAHATASDLLSPTADPAPVAPTIAPQAPVSRDDLRSVLREVVQEQMMEQQRTVQEQQRLLAAHEEAFAIAAEDFPELAQPTSTERQLFNELYAKSPIKHLPDAPLQIAYQVRGILADQRSARQTDQAKRQMAGIVPTPTGAAELGESQITQMRKRLGELRDKLRTGDRSFETYKEMRVIQSQLNRARKKR